MHVHRQKVARTLLPFPALLAIVFLALNGCQKETELGGPGATDTGAKVDGDNTFSLTLPSGEVDITQGETKTVSVGIDHGTDFNQSVDVTLNSASPGIVVEPTKATIIPDDRTYVDVKLTAAVDAPVGTTTISVVGKPGTGSNVDGTINVKVNAKDE